MFGFVCLFLFAVCFCFVFCLFSFLGEVFVVVFVAFVVLLRLLSCWISSFFLWGRGAMVVAVVHCCRGDVVFVFVDVLFLCVFLLCSFDLFSNIERVGRIGVIVLDCIVRA